MDEDTEQAAWAQLEQERQSEDEQLSRMRKTYSGFRKECDDFTAEFSRYGYTTGERNAQGK